MEDNLYEAKAMGELVQADQPGERVFGSAAGLIGYSEDWDSPMSDLELDEFLGS